MEKCKGCAIDGSGPTPVPDNLGCPQDRAGFIPIVISYREA